jgi:hypothetical protein
VSKYPSWEYRYVEVRTMLPALNTFGAEGWELIAIDAPEKGPRFYIFRRPISERKAR